MIYRPTIADPTDGHSFDDRILCPRCGEEFTPTLPSDFQAQEVCDDCREDFINDEDFDA